MARRQARIGLTGGDFEAWMRWATYLSARVGDRAFGTHKFVQAFQHALDSEAFKESRDMGQRRTVSPRFLPCGENDYLSPPSYDQLAGSWLRRTQNDFESLPLHPTFMWRVFSVNGRRSGKRSQIQRVERFENHLERLEMMDASSDARSLAILIRLRSDLRSYQRGIAGQLLAGQRGLLDGQLFRPHTAKDFYAGLIIKSNDPATIARRDFTSPGGKYIGFPKSPALAECWGYGAALDKAITQLAQRVFGPRDTRQQMAIFCQALSFNSLRVNDRPFGTSMQIETARDLGNRASIQVNEALSRVLMGDLRKADVALKSAVRLRPDLYHPLVVRAHGGERLANGRYGFTDNPERMLIDSVDEVSFDPRDIPSAPVSSDAWEWDDDLNVASPNEHLKGDLVD